jgi:hypothetical protein
VLALVAVVGCQQENQSPAVESVQQALMGPGLGNLTYSSGEVNHMISPIYLPLNAAPRDGSTNGCPTSRPTGATAPGWGTISDECKMGHFSAAAMANGYLVTPYIDKGKLKGNFAVWNVSDPRNPVRVKDYRQIPGTDTREAHTFGFNKDFDGRLLVFLQSNHGFQIWDWSNVANNVYRVADVALDGTNLNADYVGVWWTHLQFPYVYVADTDQGLYIVDVLDATNRQVINPHVVNKLSNRSDLDITRVNQVHVVGNLMMVNYSEDGKGVALLDVSDPIHPVRKYSSTAPEITYGSMFNGGRWAMAFKDAEKVGIYSVNADANGVPTGLTQLGGPFSNSDFGAGGYINFQDNVVLAGMSTRWARISPAAPPTYYTVGASVGAPLPGTIDMDFIIPLGNLVLFSNDDGGGGALMAGQTARDTTGPTPNFVSPPNGATGRPVTTRVGLTFTDTVDIDSLGKTTVIVRPVGGSAIDGYYSTQTGVVNFTPKQPLQAGTTYEVYVPAGGVKDLVGNTNPADWLTSFTTAGTASGGPPSGCSMGTDTPGAPNSSIAFSGSCTGGTGLTFTWDFGDGSATATGVSTSHTYTAVKHYAVVLTVSNSSGTVNLSRTQTVAYAPTSPQKPTRSSTIVLDTSRNRVSVVNQDAGTVASISSASPFTKQWEVSVGKSPRTLALPAANGNLWVVNQDDATISIIDGGTGAAVNTITLPAFSRPYGIAFNYAGTYAYVTLEGTGKLVKIDASTRAITATLDLGPKPRGVAVSSDGSRVLVTRLVSADTGGQVWEVSGTAMTLTRTFALPEDTTTPSSESNGPGLPNYVQSVTISPDGRYAWVPSKKDNIRRGTGPTSDGLPFDHQSRTRTIVSKLDLVNNVTDTANLHDVDNADLANTVVFNDYGDYAFVSEQGNGRIEVYDGLDHNELSTIGNVGIAPRGIVFSSGKLFVQNFMSRDVTIFDVSTVGTTNSFSSLATVSTQATEPLSAQVLLGKQIFYNSGDTRMDSEGYTSCASCHLDGDNDGRTWDFTQAGEGLRATVSLIGHGGMAEGPVHWTGNFDEIQDFENDIRGPGFGGHGFMSDSDFLATSDTLGTPKAGRSAELDALAAYLSSLTTVPTSPYRNSDGTMTSDGLAGKTLFESAGVGCATCHSGAKMTDSALNVFHDVGTIDTAAGSRRGATLTGFDTPTLIGVWNTAPYLHDGRAATLMDVITTYNVGDLHGHTSQLTSTQKTQLVAYLQQLDDYVAPPPPTLAGADIGTVGPAGSFTDNGNGSYSVSGAGADITGTADAFYFVSKDMTGDGTVTAKVVSITGGDPGNQKAGVMFRDNATGAGAMNAFALAKPASNKLQTRSATNGTTTSGTTNTITLPTWVRMTRTGNNFAGYYSTDSTNGVDGTWTQLGSTTTIAMASTAKVGLAVTSHTTSATTSVSFSNVTFSQPAAATPTFDVGSGTYNNAKTVTISTTTSGATIRYTLDGSAPTSSSAQYTAPITISNSNTTLKAFAQKTGYTDSGVASATYALVVANPTASPAGNSYSANQSVTLSTTTTGASIYYTTDGSTPTTSSTLYAGALTITGSTALRAIGVKSGMSTSGVMAEDYYLAPVSPTASPGGGSYNDVQTVSLSTTTSGAPIYYTLDGTTPAADSTLYTGPISIATTSTLKAVAIKSAWDYSAVMTAAYTLQVSTPAATLAGGTYNDYKTVNLSTATSGASIYYTLDGSTPTTGSALYTGAIAINTTSTLRAIAVKAGLNDSAVMSPVTYTLTAATPAASPAGGTYGGTQTVSLTASATSGASIYYTLDGSTPTTGSTLYTGALTISVSQTLKAIAVKTGLNNSATMTEIYTIGSPCAAPTFTNSTSGNTTGVTISTITTGASIRYTTDGSAPSSTVGTLYSTAVTITPGQTLKAIAYKSGMTDSTVSQSLYIVATGDAHVNAASTGTNYGSATQGEVKKQNAGDTTNERRLYVRFPLTGVASTITSAKVRLYGNAQASSKNITISAVSGTSNWVESTMTWASGQPSIGALQGTVSVTTTAKYWDFDVTTYVQNQKTAGATEVDFAIQQTTYNTDSPTLFNTRDNTTAKPYVNIVQ